MLVGTKAKTVSSYPEYPFINDTKAECGVFSSGRLIQRLSTISLCFRFQASRPTLNSSSRLRATVWSTPIVRNCPYLRGHSSVWQKINSSIVRWGETYALATPDGIMIKRVFPAEDSDQIRCVSYNSTDYPEFMIDRSDVRDVARITCASYPSMCAGARYSNYGCIRF